MSRFPECGPDALPRPCGSPSIGKRSSRGASSRFGPPEAVRTARRFVFGRRTAGRADAGRSVGGWLRRPLATRCLGTARSSRCGRAPIGPRLRGRIFGPPAINLADTPRRRDTRFETGGTVQFRTVSETLYHTLARRRQMERKKRARIHPETFATTRTRDSGARGATAR